MQFPYIKSPDITPKSLKVKGRVLSPDEVRRLGERLSRSPKKEQPEVFAQTITRTQQDLSKFYERNYDRPVAHTLKQRADDQANIERAIAKAIAVPHANHSSLELGPEDGKVSDTVDRLYKRSMQIRTAKLGILEQKYAWSPPCGKRLSLQTQEEAVDRLSTKSAKVKQHVLENAEKKIYGTPQPPKILSPEEFKASVEKMHNVSLENRNAKLTKIEEEYHADFPPKRTVSPDVKEALFARLYTKT
jgi:hypothetical protein